MAAVSCDRSTASGRLGLHAEGEFVAGDAGIEFGSDSARPAAMLRVELVEQIELRHAAGARSTPSGGSRFGIGLAPSVKAHALIRRGHEAGAPVPRAVDRPASRLSCITTKAGRSSFSVPRP